MLDELRRLFDDRPWAAHLYVTDQCNLDCHYCNEYDNSKPHPALADLAAWMAKIRELGAVRLGFQGGEPLLHPDIVEVVRRARELGFVKLSMSTNGLLLTEATLVALERAGLDSLQISVDRMTPTEATRKSLKSVLHKLDWFRGSRVRLNVSGVLFGASLDEARELLEACLERGVRAHARVVHDDLVGERRWRDPELTARLAAAVDWQEREKRRGRPIHTSDRILDWQRRALAGTTPDWTCVAGHKYFFVSAEGRFWPCSQVRTDTHILDVTPGDLLAWRGKKDCQSRCGVYCIIDTSLKVNHPVRFLAGEARRALSARLGSARSGARDGDAAAAGEPV